ncbi:MAG TPA: RNA 2',3'-cyclic phosphodiesterase [Noviherbaspirillum sp.]
MTVKAPESLRLFFALWPDDATASALQQLQVSMHGRRTAYANLHVTLVFLGQQPTSLLPDLKDVLAHLPRSDITLRLDHVGHFRRNRIAWVGTRHVPPTLVALHQHLVDALQKRNVAFRMEHEFTPHVTLARDAAMPADMAFDPIVWRANRVALVKSVTTAEGSRYSIVASREIDKDARVHDEGRSDDVEAP